MNEKEESYSVAWTSLQIQPYLQLLSCFSSSLPPTHQVST